MANNYTTLPFNFRRIESLQKILLTTPDGNWCLLEDIEELENVIYNNLQKLNANTIDDLLAHNIIAEKREEHAKIEIITTNLASNINSVMYSSILVLIIPTLRCDHNCEYCQASRASLLAKGYDSEDKTIEDTISFLKKIKAPSSKIEFQGGEPLLAKNYIKKFYRKAIKDLGEDTQFVICSAFGPLDSDFVEWSMNKNIFYSTSLDGSESIHISNRSSRHFNSFKKTLAGIKLIKSKLGNDRVSALATITRKTMQNPYALIDTYIENGFNSIFLRPLSPMGFAYKNDDITYTPEEFIEFYKICLNYIFHINETTTFREETAAIYIKKILSPSETGHVDLQSPSGLYLNALVINYDGNIFGSDESRMIWELTKNNDIVSGNISDSSSNILSEGNVNILSDSFLFANPGCSECAYSPYCGADPAYHLMTQGDHIGNKAFSDYCKTQKLLFDYYFELLDSEKREVLIQWIV